MSHRLICIRCHRFGTSCQVQHYYEDERESCEFRYVCKRCSLGAARGDGAE